MTGCLAWIAPAGSKGSRVACASPTGLAVVKISLRSFGAKSGAEVAMTCSSGSWIFCRAAPLRSAT